VTTTLRGLTWDHPRGLDCLRAAADEEVRRGGPVVQWEARSLQGFADQPLEQLADAYDLLVVDHPHVPQAALEGTLLPLDGTGHDAELAELAAQSVGPSHASYAVAGHQYALAIDVATQVAVHRPDLLPEPPRTWADVLDLAREGRVLWPAKPVDAISSFLTLAANCGSPVGSRPGEFVEPSVGEEVLDRLGELASLVPEHCLTENPVQTAEHLATGDRWVYCPLAYGYTNYSRAGFRPSRLAYVDMPAGSGGLAGSNLGGAGIAVSARARHREEAVAHAYWLAGAHVQRGVYFDGGGQPGNAAAWEDDRLDHEALGFFRNTRATVDAASVRPRTPGWLEVQDRVGNLVHDVLTRRTDASSCLRSAQQVWEQAVGDAAVTAGPAAQKGVRA